MKISHNGSPRQMPHSPEAEESVIGSVLLDPACIATIDLEEEDFYLYRNQVIWRVMRSLARENSKIDYKILCERLEDGKLLKDLSFIPGYISGTPTSAHVSEYASIVKEKSARRATISLAGKMAGDAYDEKSDMAQARNQWMAELISISSVRETSEPIGKFAEQLLDEVTRARENPREIYGIKTGIRDLDKITHGLQHGEVMLIPGEPGVGKSLLVAQIVRNVASEGVPCVYYGLEMRGVAVARRMVSGMTRVPTTDMRSGRVSDEQYEHIVYELGHLSAFPIFISDSPRWTTVSLHSDVARMKEKYDIQLVVVDYLRLLQDKATTPIERDELISGAIKFMASDLNVSVIGVHTLPKASRNMDSPHVLDMAGAAKMAHDPDIVMFLTQHRPSKGMQVEPSMRTCTFTKFRDGDNLMRQFHLVEVRTHDSRGREYGVPSFKDYAGNV